MNIDLIRRRFYLSQEAWDKLEKHSDNSGESPSLTIEQLIKSYL